MAGTSESAIKAVLSRYQKADVERQYLEHSNVANEYESKTDKEKIEILKKYATENDLKLLRKTPSNSNDINEKNRSKEIVLLIDSIYPKIQKDKTITDVDTDLFIKKLNTLIENINKEKDKIIENTKARIKEKLEEYQKELTRLENIQNNRKKNEGQETK